MKERLIQLLRYKNVSATRFADEIGVQRSSISHILSGRNKPSFDFIERILNTYPDINADWLILGKGTLIKGQNTGKEVSSPAKEPPIVQKNMFTEVTNTPLKASTKDIEPIQEIGISVENKNVTNVNNIQIERIVIFYKDKTFTEYKSQ